jgi:hypothetical protein
MHILLADCACKVCRCGENSLVAFAPLITLGVIFLFGAFGLWCVTRTPLD